MNHRSMLDILSWKCVKIQQRTVHWNISCQYMRPYTNIHTTDHFAIKSPGLRLKLSLRQALGALVFSSAMLVDVLLNWDELVFGVKILCTVSVFIGELIGVEASNVFAVWPQHCSFWCLRPMVDHPKCNFPNLVHHSWGIDIGTHTHTPSQHYKNIANIIIAHKRTKIKAPSVFYTTTSYVGAPLTGKSLVAQWWTLLPWPPPACKAMPPWVMKANTK